MIYVIVGILLGLLVSLGPLAWIATPFDYVATSLVNSTSSLISNLFGFVGVETTTSDLAATFAAVMSAAAPGFLALLLVTLSKATQPVRRRAASLLIVFALISFFILPPASSFVLLGCALIFGVLSGFLAGPLLTLPLMLFATILGARYGVLIWQGGEEGISTAANTLAELTHMENFVGLWKIALSAVGLFPFFLAAKAALKKQL